MSDPFASHTVAAEAQVQAHAARARYAQSTPPLAVAAMQAQQSRRSTPTGSPNLGEFGTSVPVGASQSTGARHHRVSMGHGQYTPPHPVASTSATPAIAYGFLPPTSTAVGPSHHSMHPAQVMQAQITPPNAQSRKRASHNPAATLAQSSPPKPEQLTDEYVLHPSVYAYKAERPGKPMVGFGPYVLLRTLGTGEFGKVKLGVHTDYGVEVAIKLIRRGSLEDESMANKVEREIDVLKTLKHPNIVRMFDVIDTDKYVGIVIEFAAGGELFEHILASRFLKDRDAQKLFAQLISGVDYLHRKGIIHRDLKLENLLLDKHRNIIITDFGFANCFEAHQQDLMTTSCGSPCYAAPELVVSEGAYVGSAVDIWSCGIILYAMLSGYLPYDDDPDNPDGDDIQQLYRYIIHTPTKFPEHVSEASRDLIECILVPDPRYRANMYDIMTHPWLAAHRQLFERTVEMNEWIFQDQMYKKSQQAKKELNERKRVQRDAHMARYRVQRSQSTMPAIAGQEPSTTKRPKSAMPGSASVPYASVATLEQVQQPYRQGAPVALAPELTPNPSETISTKAVENQSVAPSSASLPLETHEAGSSSNSNRHTIQIEYDPEDPTAAASYDDDTRVPIQMSHAMSDISASGSEGGHADDTFESVESRLSPVLAASERSPVKSASPVRPIEPTTPKRKSPIHQGSPSTPRASNAVPVEDMSATPRASMITPKGKGRAHPPLSRSNMMPPPTIPAPKAQRNRKGMSLDKFGLAKLLGTSQAGSSVDLARPTPLSASTTASTPGSAAAAATRALQTSTAANAGAGYRPQSLGPSLPAPKEQKRLSARPQSAAGMNEDRKSKRKTLGIMTRTPSVREKTNTVPLSARDMNPATAPVHGTNETKVPDSASRPSMSSARPSNLNSPSVLTVDAVNGGHKTASSSAAKKVMDWFRRKSVVKESAPLQQVKATGRNDSADSFVRVEPTVVASAMSDTSSVAPTADGRITPAPPIAEEDEQEVVKETETETETEKEQERVPEPEPRASTASLAPPIEAPVKAEGNNSRQSLSPSPLPEPTHQPLASADAEPRTVRVSPPRATPSRSKSHGMPGGATPSLSSQATATAAGSEDSRLRVHMGVLDQSALSSKPPQDIMNEVIRVLMEMGMEVKRENEYRVRCTRVKRKGRGFGSVISMAGGVMGSASLSRLDSRGFPIPSSPSSNSILSPGGIRGMLRRGSTTPSSVMAKSPSDLDAIRASPGFSSTGTLHSPAVPSATFEPIYGDHGVDSGDEVKFNVEVCRIKNLPGLYLLNIKRLRGSVWSFKFVYQTIIDRCETLTH